MSPAEADALIIAMGADGERVPARFARGCRAFAVTDGAGVVAYGWLSAGAEWIGELGLEITPASGEAYIWNCFTLAPHRRRGHYRAVLEGIVSVARDEGLSRLWIGSVDVPAEKADADAGFVRVLSFEVTPGGAGTSVAVKPAPGSAGALVDAARRRLALRGWTHDAPSRARVQ